MIPTQLFSGKQLSNYSIYQRLRVLIGSMGVALAIIAVLTAFALNYANRSAARLQDLVTRSNQVANTVDALQRGFVESLNQLNGGMITWSEASQRNQKARIEFKTQLESLIASSETEQVRDFQQKSKQVYVAMDAFEPLAKSQSVAALELFVLNDLTPLIEPFADAAREYGNQMTASAQESFTATSNTLTAILWIGLALVAAALAASLWFADKVRRSITEPIAVISDTVQKVQANDTSARTKLEGQDELAQLGQALDALLDEKVTTLLRIERENEGLNNSVIELLEGTMQLSDRDLTVSLKVNEDVTGPVADALNLVTKETAEALFKILQISRLVERSSTSVSQQSGRVSVIAASERKLVGAAIAKLESVSENMNQIAKWCQSTREVAQTASGYTDKAYSAVSDTVVSMGSIRDSVSETEKRIKRLSERSQEISGIVDIINNIAERTHVLALNASMQAAAAGDAGRGFAVVADEVQRLAESSRQSTSQIGLLVRNIQQETTAAVENINNTISQVVTGSKLAEQAGQTMEKTQQSTKDLVASVENISEKSIAQAKEAETLKKSAGDIQKSTQITDKELQSQAKHNLRLRHAATELLNTVTVFRLPVIEKPEIPEEPVLESVG